MSDTKKHTPGPWRTFNGTDVYPDDDDTEGTRHIADCDMDGSIGGDEKRANARLIAAAPDMLDALRSVLRTYEREFPNGEAVIRIRAAIAKAEGGAA